MDFSQLLGKTFSEKEFYELLLFELEASYRTHEPKFIHFYFDRLSGEKIKITDVVYFGSSEEKNRKDRTIIETKEWFEVEQLPQDFNLRLCRIDRTGWISFIWRGDTITHDSKLGWADERPARAPMTPEEIRLGFQELASFFQDQQEFQPLKSKKAVQNEHTNSRRTFGICLRPFCWISPKWDRSNMSGRIIPSSIMVDTTAI
jgi:hypothetical protein